MDFKDLIQARHSVRKYAGGEIDRAVIDEIIDMAMTAPSSRNSRSSAFMVVEDPDTLAALSEVRESGGAFLKEASAAIIVLGDQSKSDMWVINSSISATFVQLAAVEKGLGSCWVQVEGRYRSKPYQKAAAGEAVPEEELAQHLPGLAEDYVRELLGIRENMRVLCIIALGPEA